MHLPRIYIYIVDNFADTFFNYSWFLLIIVSLVAEFFINVGSITLGEGVENIHYSLFNCLFFCCKENDI